MDVRPWDKPQSNHHKELKFGNVEFFKTPTVFMALNQFDFKAGHNLRVRAYPENVSKDGMTWHIDSWSDTVLYSTGVSILAVN
jgi:hypothetical protein